MLSNQDCLDITASLEQAGHRHLYADSDERVINLRKTHSTTQTWQVQQQLLRGPHLLNPEAVTVNVSDANLSDEELPEGQAVVRAPLPGVFYRAAKPGARPFVEVGDRVTPQTQVCIIESMKLMNSVYAGVSGRVVEISLKDGHFAEKHGVLIRVEEDL